MRKRCDRRSPPMSTRTAACRSAWRRRSAGCRSAISSPIWGILASRSSESTRRPTAKSRMHRLGCRRKRCRPAHRAGDDGLPVRSAAPVFPGYGSRRCSARVRRESCSARVRREKGIDSRRIEDAVADGWLSVTAVQVTERFPRSLGRGEIEAIQLALDAESALLIMDDRLARREAMRRGLDYLPGHRWPAPSGRAAIRRRRCGTAAAADGNGGVSHLPGTLEPVPVVKFC